MLSKLISENDEDSTIEAVTHGGMINGYIVPFSDYQLIQSLSSVRMIPEFTSG